MKEFKGTKGEWLIDVRDSTIEKHTNHIVITSDKGSEICLVNHNEKEIPLSEYDSNTQLIADAGTTVNKCGLLPSELLDQRNELLKSLQSCLRLMKQEYRGLDEDTVGQMKIRVAEQAINKALGK